MTTSASDLVLKKTYNFSVYPAAILGSDWKNVLVMAIMDYETVLAFDDVNAVHESVKPYLPADVPNDPMKYDWVKVKVGSQVTYLGLPWINEETIEEVTTTRLAVTIEGSGASDVAKLRNALSMNGFRNFTITVNEVVV